MENQAKYRIVDETKEIDESINAVIIRNSGHYDLLLRNKFDGKINLQGKTYEDEINLVNGLQAKGILDSYAYGNSFKRKTPEKVENIIQYYKGRWNKNNKNKTV